MLQYGVHLITQLLLSGLVSISLASSSGVESIPPVSFIPLECGQTTLNISSSNMSFVFEISSDELPLSNTSVTAFETGMQLMRVEFSPKWAWHQLTYLGPEGFNGSVFIKNLEGDGTLLQEGEYVLRVGFFEINQELNVSLTCDPVSKITRNASLPLPRYETAVFEVPQLQPLYVSLSFPSLTQENQYLGFDLLDLKEVDFVGLGLTPGDYPLLTRDAPPVARNITEFTGFLTPGRYAVWFPGFASEEPPQDIFHAKLEFFERNFCELVPFRDSLRSGDGPPLRVDNCSLYSQYSNLVEESSICEVSCPDSRELLSQNVSVQCLSNGSWTAVPENLTCHNSCPRRVFDDNFVESLNLPFFIPFAEWLLDYVRGECPLSLPGDTCPVRCKDVPLSVNLTCGETGVWALNASHCDFCYLPDLAENLENATIAIPKNCSQFTRKGQSCELECPSSDPSLSLGSHTSVECDGLRRAWWSRSIPQCKKYCKRPDLDLSSTGASHSIWCPEHTEVNDTCQIECAIGQRFLAHDSAFLDISCEDADTWASLPHSAKCADPSYDSAYSCGPPSIWTAFAVTSTLFFSRNF